jgi:hypothetical protein
MGNLAEDVSLPVCVCDVAGLNKILSGSPAGRGQRRGVGALEEKRRRAVGRQHNGAAAQAVVADR